MQRADSTSDPLAPLEAIDRLTVGAPVVEPTRVRSEYEVERNGNRDSFELSFRWQEPVLDPDSESDRNLASLITLQPALNYGLFCNHMVLAGELDSVDRRFVEDMLANTAREIFVNKILRPNPFLVGFESPLPPVRRSSYVRATLEIPTASRDRRLTSRPWSGSGYAVLSSGGKDSLLTYGLLHEIGFEPHPIFVNESGRHWFTALNAYRWFEKEVPGTARVWTNADRLFNWMLRHLPFVRPDFASLRADIYPIRLWTVAVFLFAALPLLRHHGLGSLVIGDEYDTTVRETYRGIPHYAGLFDQGRLFDRALSRYFQRKRWGVRQYSVLRPMSELLIEKTLAERYPELLALQVSCHAASSTGEGGPIRPCGRCEKCRRIVAMLTAVGVDAGLCGYAETQIDSVLDALPQQGVHQERPAIEHLGWLLRQRGRLRGATVGGIAPVERPEITSLRFHPRRSPAEDLPVELRGPLFGILLQHAEGALVRRDRQWHPVDPALLATDATEPEGLPPGSETVRWGEMSWPQARERLQRVDLALLPVGAVEQHGPHLPLDTDAFDAERLSLDVARRCREPRPLVLPSISYGVSYHHDDFAGTLSISNDTLARLVYDVGMAAARNGIRKLIVVNGHGGNAATLSFAAQMINRDAHIFTCVDTGETSDREVYALAETPNDVHAGEIETSTSLAMRPELVDMKRAEAFVPSFSSRYLDFTAEGSIDWYARTARISASGVLGDPTKASAEKGRAMWELMIHHLVALVEHLMPLTLDEIYERRY